VTHSTFRGSFDESSDWRLPAAVAVVAVLAFHALWTLVPPMHGDRQLWVANVVTDASVAVALLLVTLVAIRYRGSRLGLAWRLIAVGLAFNLFAEVSYSAQDVLIAKEVPFPSVSDAGYVGAYLPTLIGLLLMPQAAVSAVSRVKLGLDALIVTVALAILSWFLVVEKILGSSGESPLAQVISIYYPYADLAIVLAAFVLVARASPGKFALAFSLLGAGFFMTALSDSGYAYLTEAGYESGGYVDIGWVAGYTLLSLAALSALHPSASYEPNSRRAEAAPNHWRSLVPYAAVVPVAVLLVVQASEGGAGMVATLGFLALLTLITMRQVIANYENVQLNESLRDLTANLEVRVREKTMELMRNRSQEAGGRPAASAPREGSERFEGFPDWPDELPARPRSSG
jgi:hypothetical protein